MNTTAVNTGSRYGLLTVVENLGYRQVYGRNKTVVRARCDCGKEVEIELTRLVSGHKKSCGHLRAQSAAAMCVSRDRRYAVQRLESGTQFGRLKVVEDLGIQLAYGKARSLVKVRCECGNEKTVLRASLVSGKAKSCGCRRAEVMRTIGSLGLNRKAPGAAASHSVYCAYAKRAKNRGLMWQLSENDFIALARQNCFYCGAAPANVSKSGVYSGDFVYNGIDRIDSEAGYVAGNMVACCAVCNRAKSDMPLNEFLAWIETFRRPSGDVAIERILDKRGRLVTLNEAVRRGWLGAPNTPIIEDYRESDTRNLFLDQGRQLMAYAFGFRAPIQDYVCQRFGVGTGVTAARVTDVALEAPVTLSSGSTTKAIDVVDFISPFVCRVSFTLGINDANGYILSEMGLYSGNLTLMARKIRAISINKTSDFAPTLTWRIRF